MPAACNCTDLPFWLTDLFSAPADQTRNFFGIFTMHANLALVVCLGGIHMLDQRTRAIFIGLIVISIIFFGGTQLCTHLHIQ